MRLLDFEPIYRKPRLHDGNPCHSGVSPSRRRSRSTQRIGWWCAYITYIPVQGRFLYLPAIMDCACRRVLVWPLSNTSETEFCLASVAIEVYGIAETFNTLWESKFTDIAFTDLREAERIRCWMDGRGRRRLGHAFIERLRRSFAAVYCTNWQTASRRSA